MKPAGAVRAWCRIAILASLTTGVVLATPAGALPKRETYTQPIWFEWDTTQLDVLIIPPLHGQLYNGNGVLNGNDPNELVVMQNSYLRAIEAVIADWDRAVHSFGSGILRKGLRVSHYVVGRDTIPADALQEPEIILVTDEANPRLLGSNHHHARVCVSRATQFYQASLTYADMYNVMSHTYGRCLGLDNVILPQRRGLLRVLKHDVMYSGYTHNPGFLNKHFHCVSNLNVAGLELVFAGVLGTKTDTQADLPVSNYTIDSCARRHLASEA